MLKETTVKQYKENIMADLTDTEAHTIIRGMRDRAVNDVLSLRNRIVDLNKDLAKDPYEDTAAQIKRLESRLDVRFREAEALAIAATKF